MSRSLVSAAAVTASLLVASVSVASSQAVEVAPAAPGVVHDARQLFDKGGRRPYGERRERFISEIGEDQAVEAAQAKGIEEVDEVRRSRFAFKVRGTDADGRRVEVTVDRRTGEVEAVR